MENDLTTRIQSSDAGSSVLLTKISSANNTRLDVFCGVMLTENSVGTRSYAQKLIKQGLVTVNGKLSKPNACVNVGDTISICLPQVAPLTVEPQNIPLDIVYQDEWIAVINKPKGMVVHPGPGNPDNTLVNAALFHICDLSGISGVLRPGIVHRIDKLTSGLLVVAKNDSAHISLSNQLKEHTASRVYIALVHGNIKEDNGTIDIPIARHPNDRQKMAAIKPGTKLSAVAKNAVTHYRVLERMGQYTLIEARLETGRTHQIRVHMRHINHPVAGDDVYCSSKNQLGLCGQALHAIALHIKHPATESPMSFFAPLPEYFINVLRALKADTESITLKLTTAYCADKGGQ